MASVRRFLSDTNSSSRVSVASISAYADSNSESRLDEEGGITEEVENAIVGTTANVGEIPAALHSSIGDVDKNSRLSLRNSKYKFLNVTHSIES